MTVYVDDVALPFGRMKMCHMWADTLDELLAMVDTIGVDRKWIQGHPTLSHGKHRMASWVHFDVSMTKKALAIQRGAVLTDILGPVEAQARQRLTHENPHMREMAQRRLRTIAEMRERRKPPQGELL